MHNRLSLHGFALLFAIGVLALLSAMIASFVPTMSMDRSLGANFLHQTRARLAAESGVDYAVAAIRALPGGPVSDGNWFLPANADSSAGGPAIRRDLHPDTTGSGLEIFFEVAIADESGKLNLNNPNSPVTADMGEDPYGFSRGMLAGTVGILAGLVLEDVSRGRQVAEAIFFDAEHGRSRYPNDRFPSQEALVAALRQAGLSEAEISRLLRQITILSWQDPAVLKPCHRVHGMLSGGYVRASAGGEDDAHDLATLDGAPVEQFLALQGRGMAMESRAPVNLNLASVELIQALIQPVFGAYLQEGPGDTQSSEHYGWWATGRGIPDANAAGIGRLARTRPLTETAARRLAKAIHDRIHGGARNPDISNDWATSWAGAVTWDDQQSDTDGDGKMDAHPFSTWEEFQHFLNYGIAGGHPLNSTPAFATGTAAGDIYLGPDFAPALNDAPVPYTTFTDPHLAWSGSGLPAGHPDAGANWKYRNQYLPTVVAGVNNWNAAYAENWKREDAARRRIEAIYANANPNTLLNDFNPNANSHLDVDKNQLLLATTEFCFEPTGVFAVQSRGVVASRDKTLATRAIDCAMECFRPVRVTTQQQFMGAMSIPEEIYERVSTPAIPSMQPYAFSASGPANGALRHVCLASYPEPFFADAQNGMPWSTIDGCLRLADKERANGMLGSGNNQISNPFALAHFNADSPAPFLFDNGNFQVARTVPQPLTHDTGALPGNLHPDGVYCEMGRSFGIALNSWEFWNVHFWVKPNFRPGIATRIHKFLSGPSMAGAFANQTLPSLYFFPNAANSQLTAPAGTSITTDWKPFCLYSTRREQWVATRSFAFGWAWEYLLPDQNFQYSNRHYRGVDRTASPTVNHDFPWKVNPGATPASAFDAHRWTHLVVGWRPDRDHHNTRSILYINGTAYGKAHSHHSGGYGDGGGIPGLPFRLPNIPAGSQLSFGERYGPSDAVAAHASPYYADATIDEIMMNSTGVYGGSNNTETYVPEQGQAWNAGRYFAGSIQGESPATGPRAVYTSPLISLRACLPDARGRVTLRSCSWTYYRPRKNRVYTASGLVSSYGEDNVMGMPVNPSDRRDPMIDFWNEGITETRYSATADRRGNRQWDPLAMDIGDSDGRWLGENLPALTDPAGSQAPSADGSRDFQPVFTAGESFQFKAKFFLKDGQRLYESPVLDDVTFTFSFAQPRVIAWTSK